jgi:APA family basic amino acid/polyamine antiporter
MLKYMACSLSAARVATHHPELHQRSHIRLGARQIAIISYAGAVVALAITALGIEADWRPYLLVGGWLALGILYWLVRGRHARALDAA